MDIKPLPLGEYLLPLEQLALTLAPDLSGNGASRWTLPPFPESCPL